MKEVKYGWDMSLKAQPRREMITPSVWLREDNDGGNFRDFMGIQTVSRSGKPTGNFTLWKSEIFMSSILGFNLERRGTQDKGNELNLPEEQKEKI